jgi:hypothetical protein
MAPARRVECLHRILILVLYKITPPSWSILIIILKIATQADKRHISQIKPAESKGPSFLPALLLYILQN